jgi:hypothetical protein
VDALDWLYAVAATPSPGGSGGGSSGVDGFTKIVDSLAGLVTAFGSLAGLLAAIGAVIVLIRNKRNGGGGPGTGPPAGTP